jgi:hypothetical protein
VKVGPPPLLGSRVALLETPLTDAEGRDLRETVGLDPSDPALERALQAGTLEQHALTGVDPHGVGREEVDDHSTTSDVDLDAREEALRRGGEMPPPEM